jgi:hypothetical protein
VLLDSDGDVIAKSNPGDFNPIPVRLDLYLPQGIKMPGEAKTGIDAKMQTYAILNIWQCPVCLRGWIDKLDGQTHTICEECTKKQKASGPN